MERNTRSKLMETVATELARVWIISFLTFFLALAAEIEWLKFLLAINIIGIPVLVTCGLVAVLIGAVYVFWRNRQHWERSIYYVGMGNRHKRLSLTDVRPDEVDWLYATEDMQYLWK